MMKCNDKKYVIPSVVEPRKREYSTLSIECLDMVSASPILVGSIISKSKIKATGQEVGATYDMADDTENTFNHVWE